MMERRGAIAGRPLRLSPHPLREDAWLAGFADGEGHFSICPLRGARFPAGSYQPRFEITLRDDDRPILEELVAAFGGAIKSSHHNPSRNQKPQARWTVGAKVGLRALVDYFDTHPLRAKKARDYAIWSCAVGLYEAEGYRAPGLVALADQLVAIRKYDHST